MYVFCAQEKRQQPKKYSKQQFFFNLAFPKCVSFQTFYGCIEIFYSICDLYLPEESYLF